MENLCKNTLSIQIKNEVESLITVYRQNMGKERLHSLPAFSDTLSMGFPMLFTWFFPKI